MYEEKKERKIGTSPINGSVGSMTEKKIEQMNRLRASQNYFITPLKLNVFEKMEKHLML